MQLPGGAYTLLGSISPAVNRLAASPEVVEAITRHYRSDGVPDPAAGHLAAETVSHPEAMDTRIERFRTIHANLQSKGYSDEAAQNLAVEMMETGEEPGQSRRFQLLNDEEEI